MPAVRRDLGDFVEAGRQVPELDEILRNPQLDKRAKAAAVDAVAGEGDPLVLNLLRLLVEKGRGGEVARGRRRSSSGWPPPRRASCPSS